MLTHVASLIAVDEKFKIIAGKICFIHSFPGKG
jgi:hypothetical protein